MCQLQWFPPRVVWLWNIQVIFCTKFISKILHHLCESMCHFYGNKCHTRQVWYQIKSVIDFYFSFTLGIIQILISTIIYIRVKRLEIFIVQSPLVELSLVNIISGVLLLLKSVPAIHRFLNYSFSLYFYQVTISCFNELKSYSWWRRLVISVINRKR